MIITKDTSSLHKIRHHLPSTVSGALSRLDKATLDKISEIRLRANGITTITIEGKNLVLSLKGLTRDCSLAIKCTKGDIDDFIYRFCKGSVFSHENSIKQNYITCDGIRLGLGSTCCGAFQIPAEITSINIRLPRHISGCSDTIMKHISENGFTDGRGLLIISNPGVGKTTLLRDLAYNLSTGNKTDMKRVCVIDERDEIYMEKVFENCCIDFLSGIDKCKGIETACRLLSPEIIICDEISGSDEAQKIALQKNCGIVFIATYHADSAKAALKKEYIRKMFDEGVFSHIVLLSRNGSKVSCHMTEYKNA